MTEVELAKNEFGEVLFDIDVELGRKMVKVRELLNWEKGTILKFTKTSGEPVDFLVNGKPLALGEIMVLDERFAVRITEILEKEDLTEMYKNGMYR
ncbi:surface presentation of antigens (SPOA) protein [Denitrovibrio acetiphilus DSM 12809]|uniref:Flagellar motor switch protein FliN n=1 Tax=Denitrovibrio acetiphilus (strain DSM 12809 / NBRC 114555 / N2460) TaxID=522772 RepID=D4H2N2_DENA2|nr:FliM/FliN family flagellar motor C-terminal domain-containing protein [Denitrovibrio acetiphilus]ADD67093.1 surface presentation of antigens (SPOA) protein [Denitrovibrio acetiphilus DSM 12809]